MRGATPKVFVRFLRKPGTGGTVTFKYDLFGRRIEKISPSGTTIYAYDEDNIIEELNTGGSPTARYTQGLGIDEPLEVYEGGKSYYYHADGLGSIVALTKSTGTAANTYFEYNTFGADPDASETVPNPFRFTGREWDSETSLYYYRARYYDPLFGRFLSEDPIGFWADTNFYRYVQNDPAGLTDASGLAALVFDRGSGTLSLYSGSGQFVGTYGVPNPQLVETVEAGNYTTNPRGNPNTLGCHCPAPNGSFPVLRPVAIPLGQRYKYGPYFFPIGAPGSLIRKRGIGLHGGRTGPKYPTWGCIRVSNTDITALYDYNKVDPIITITIQ